MRACREDKARGESTPRAEPLLSHSTHQGASSSRASATDTGMRRHWEHLSHATQVVEGDIGGAAGWNSSTKKGRARSRPPPRRVCVWKGKGYGVRACPVEEEGRAGRGGSGPARERAV